MRVGLVCVFSFIPLEEQNQDFRLFTNSKSVTIQQKCTFVKAILNILICAVTPAPDWCSHTCKYSLLWKEEDLTSFFMSLFSGVCGEQQEAAISGRERTGP